MNLANFDAHNLLEKIISTVKDFAAAPEVFGQVNFQTRLLAIRSEPVVLT